MKKKIYIRGFLIIILLCFIVTIKILLSIFTKQTTEKHHFIQNKKCKFYYDELFIMYFYDNYQFPGSVNEMLDYINDESLSLIFLHNFTDPFSKQNNLLTYLPVTEYSDTIGYLLLSTGVDGKIDNISSSVSKDNLSTLKIYNKNYPFASSNAYIPDTIFPYNIIDLFFGKRDYLVMYINGKELFLNFTEIITVDSLINHVLNRNLTPKGKTVKAAFQFQTINPDISFLELKNISAIKIFYNDYIIINKYPKNRYPEVDFLRSDTLRIAGLLENFDLETKNITFGNCFFNY